MSLDQPTDFVKHQTLDAFLGGRLTLAQPATGFRAGMDSVLLGASVAQKSRNILDLGAGVGTAALVALAHGSDREALLVDSDEAALALAQENIARNGFAGRVRTQRLDVAAGGKPHGSFDTVIANPPYYAEGESTLATTRGTAARAMDPAALDAWVRTAAANASAGGQAIFILPAYSLNAVLNAYSGRFGAVAILPLSTRPGEPARRILIRGIRNSRAPLTLLSTRAIHGPDGPAFAPEFEAIFRGEDVLHW
jgi:tRNA1(Val) A37 N6-methylase TrmN6